MDSTVLIDHLRGRGEARGFLHGLATDGHTLGVCCVNVAELYAGCLPSELANADKLIKGVAYYEASVAAAERAGKTRYQLARQGITVATSDALIGMIALAEGAVVITRNAKDFQAIGIPLLSPPWS